MIKKIIQLIFDLYETRAFHLNVIPCNTKKVNGKRSTDYISLVTPIVMESKRRKKRWFVGYFVSESMKINPILPDDWPFYSTVDELVEIMKLCNKYNLVPNPRRKIAHIPSSDRKAKKLWRLENELSGIKK